MSTASNDSTDRIHELEAKVAQLTSLVERLAPAAPPAIIPTTATEVEAAPTATSSRRGMLKLAGAAAAGAVAVAVSSSMPAAADDGDHIPIGETTATTAASRESTQIVYSNTLNPQVPGAILGSKVNANILTVRDTPSGPFFFGNAGNSSFPAAIGGYSYRTVANGVYGFTSNPGAGVVGQGSDVASNGVLGTISGSTATGAGVLGTVTAAAATGSGVFGKSDATTVGASAGLRGRSAAGPALVLEPTATGQPTTGTWAQGAIVPDTTGALWYCTVAGTPGTWVNLVPSNSGRFFPVVPGRLYDSRGMTPAGALAAGATRDILLRDKVNSGTFALETANYVPAGAKAIACNVTVVNTVGSGFLAVNPLADAVVHAATINWSASGQILNNGVTISLGGDRQVTVIAGGSSGAATDFVIDVTGYYL